jgi:phosphate transport system substrate-binding protein
MGGFNLSCKQRKIINKKMIATIAFFIIFISGFSGCVQQDGKNTIKVSGAFSLYPMMVIWAEQYQKLHSEIQIEISSGGAGKGMSDAIAGIVNLGMVSRDIRPEETNQGVIGVSVVKDAVLPTINANNPYIDTILQNGLTKQQLHDIFITGSITTWGQLLNTSSSEPIRVYSRSDPCGAAETWAHYLGDYTQDDFTTRASKVKDDPGVAGAVISDTLGIGYNNVNYIYSYDTKKPYAGIKPVPIDHNENGTIDSEEDFYETRDDVVNAEITGALPTPPSRYVYLVTKNAFTGITKEFVEWILTEGQQYVISGGYGTLSNETIAEQLQIISG